MSAATISASSARTPRRSSPTTAIPCTSGHLRARRSGRAGVRASRARSQLHRRPPGARRRAALRFSNLTSLTRDESDIRHPPAPFGSPISPASPAPSRAPRARASWKRRFIAPGGQLITPFTYLQADANWIASDDPGAGLGADEADRPRHAGGRRRIRMADPRDARLDGSHVRAEGAAHRAAGRTASPATCPNEDSQSLVFDDTNLFEWDKFAGYDRQEGGTRANLGFLYQGLFPNGAIDRRARRPLLPARRRELLRLAGPCADRLGSGPGDGRFRLCRPRHREYRLRARR